MLLSKWNIVKMLVLWYTPTFTTITTHEELEPIMETLGFTPLPLGPTKPGARIPWKEYAFRLTAEPRPRPGLPYISFEGLHIDTYRVFLRALAFCLGPLTAANLFHLRSKSVGHERVVLQRLYCLMDRNLDNENIYVYRKGTFESYKEIVFYGSCNNGVGNDGEEEEDIDAGFYNNALLGKSYNSSPSNPMRMALLTDLLPT